MTHEGSYGAFAGELIACIADGREPSVQELFVVAEQVWVEGAADRSAFAWGGLGPDHPDRLRSLRAAHAALCGTVEGVR